jgi:hypothetical protein
VIISLVYLVIDLFISCISHLVVNLCNFVSNSNTLGVWVV